MYTLEYERKDRHGSYKCEFKFSLQDPKQLFSQLRNNYYPKIETIFCWVKQNVKILELAKCLAKLGPSDIGWKESEKVMGLVSLVLSKKLPSKVIVKLLKVCAYHSLHQPRKASSKKVKKLATEYLPETSAYNLILQNEKELTFDSFLNSFKTLPKDLLIFFQQNPEIIERTIKRLITNSEKETNTAMKIVTEGIFKKVVKGMSQNEFVEFAQRFVLPALTNAFLHNKRIVLTKKVVELKLNAPLNRKIEYSQNFLDKYLREHRPEFVEKYSDYVDDITIQVIQRGDKTNKVAIQSAIKRIVNLRKLFSLFTHADQEIRRIAKKAVKKKQTQVVFETLKHRIGKIKLNWEEILSTEVYKILTSKNS